MLGDPYIKARRGSPDTVASSTDDGTLIDVAGADEAIPVLRWSASVQFQCSISEEEES